jgi:hypothetical protein
LIKPSPAGLLTEEANMIKAIVILMMAMSLHALGHAAEAPEDGKEAATPSVPQRQNDPTVGRDAAPATPALPVQPGAVNPANGQYYPPTGNGDVINPATGERYIGTPGGYINPNTGEFMPKIR